jgi:hypothetical protein
MAVVDDVAPDCGALSEAVVFLNHFKDMPDPRQRGKVMYPLDEVLLLALLAVLAGAESFVDIARFGCKKLDLLGGFARSPMALRRTIISAIFSPPSTRNSSNAASSPGSPR